MDIYMHKKRRHDQRLSRESWIDICLTYVPSPKHARVSVSLEQRCLRLQIHHGRVIQHFARIMVSRDDLSEVYVI